MDSSNYVFSSVTAPETPKELGLSPIQEPAGIAEDEHKQQKKTGQSFLDRLNNALNAIDKGADTVNRVLETGQKATGGGSNPSQQPQTTQPVQASGIDIKTIGWLSAAALGVLGLMKIVTPNKKK